MARKTPMEKYADKRKASLKEQGNRPDFARAVQSKTTTRADKKTEKADAKKPVKIVKAVSKSKDKTGKKKKKYTPLKTPMTMAEAMGKVKKKAVKPVPVKIVHDAPSTSARDHDARWDLETLTKAAEIKKDKKRAAAVKAEAKRQAQALTTVIGSA